MAEARRIFRDRKDPFEEYERESEFRRRYRLSKAAVEELAEEFGRSQWASKGTKKAKGLSHRERVCLALRFLASGALYSTCGDTQQVNKSTVCRAVWAVVNFVNSLQDRYIRWPQPNEYTARAREFFQIRRFPKVVGAVDGTHVPIRNPNRVHNNYYNRKHFTSINVMVVCNADLTFSHVDARAPGSANDAHVLRTSPVSVLGEEGGLNGYVLLGDSGYPQREFLMTPFLQANTPAQQSYNAAHISTRCTVERAIGVLKQRFRCLDASAGYIMSSPESVSCLIVACCILHNMAIRNQQELDLDEIPMMEDNNDGIQDGDDDEDGDREVIRNRLYLQGLRAREEIVENYFQRAV